MPHGRAASSEESSLEPNLCELWLLFLLSLSPCCSPVLFLHRPLDLRLPWLLIPMPPSSEAASTISSSSAPSAPFLSFPPLRTKRSDGRTKGRSICQALTCSKEKRRSVCQKPKLDEAIHDRSDLSAKNPNLVEQEREDRFRPIEPLPPGSRKTRRD